MKNLMKNNPMLVFGLGLPLVMVMVFAIASNFPRVGETPPQYDVIFAGSYSGPGNGIQLQVVNQKLVVSVLKDTCYFNLPKLYQYTPKTENVREIPLIVPPEIALRNTTNCTPGSVSAVANIPVPELEQVKLSNSSISPDGYQFLSNDYSSDSPAILTDIFIGSSRYRYGGVLKKGNYRIRLPQTEGSYSNPEFIGWIVP